MSDEFITYSTAQVNKEYPPFEFELIEERIKDYLAAVQDDNSYYDQQREAPATIAAVYARWSMISGHRIQPGNIHAKQHYKFFKAVSPGQRLKTIGKVVDKYMKKENKCLELETHTYDESGDLVAIGRMMCIGPE